MDDQNPRYAKNFENAKQRWNELIEGFLTGLERLRAFLDAVPKKVEAALERFEDNISVFVGVHLTFLRVGYLPSLPLLRWRENPQEIRAADVAVLYGKSLHDQGIVEAAILMERLADIVRLGHHDFSVRAIFPEIERIAREEAYEVGVTDGIASLPSLRIAVNELLLERAAGESSRTAGKIDIFILTIISAFDFAYSSTSKSGGVPKPESVLYRHAFHKVPNRHLVCHGHNTRYDEVHVVNALTLLFVMAKIGFVFKEIGYRVPQTAHDQSETLSKWRETRRSVNRSYASLFKALGGKPKRKLVAFESNN